MLILSYPSFGNRLADAAGVFIRDVQLDLLRELGEFLVEDFLCALEQDDTALARGDAAHDEHMLDVIELGVVRDRVAEIGADGVVDGGGARHM